MAAHTSSEDIRNTLTGRRGGGERWAHTGPRPAKLRKPRTSKPQRLPHPQYDGIGYPAHVAIWADGWVGYDPADHQTLFVGIRPDDGRICVWDVHGPRRQDPNPGQHITQVLYEGRESAKAVSVADERLQRWDNITRRQSSLDLAAVRAALRRTRAALRQQGAEI